MRAFAPVNIFALTIHLLVSLIECCILTRAHTHTHTHSYTRLNWKGESVNEIFVGADMISAKEIGQQFWFNFRQQRIEFGVGFVVSRRTSYTLSASEKCGCAYERTTFSLNDCCCFEVWSWACLCVYVCARE